jgi:hypothetical protein
LRGMLSSMFIGAVAKRLTLVETITEKSNQHEFQGVRPMKALLGVEDRRRMPAKFIWLTDGEGSLSVNGFASWSDVRKGRVRKNGSPRSEYHLYYPGNAVTELMKPDDLLLIALQRDDSLLVVIAPDGSTSQSQLLWLFGLDQHLGSGFVGQQLGGASDNELGFAARYILDELGIEAEEPEAACLDALLERFGLEFPKSREFSDLARSSLPDVSALEDPDEALLRWLDQEEKLFRRLERKIVAERISAGFEFRNGVDVDGFLSFSLSVQNRRKARAGLALENHLEAVFQAQALRYIRGAETENRNKPDFLFPGALEYADHGFSTERLTMLGAKSTLKDRWRQVLSEAERVSHKHLLTLEPGISTNQTDEMRAKSLQLVLPRGLHGTYRPSQRAWLMDMRQFLSVVRERQNGA